MHIKSIFSLFLGAAFIVTIAAGASAQTSPVRGEVRMQKQDGTVVPVADATVEAYRVDIGRGTMPPSKTNRKGEFSFVGFPLGQTFALAVSGPGIGPRVEPRVKAGQENLVIVVTEGDGRKLTEDEVREVVAAVGTGTGQMTEEDRKKQAELEKKNAEIAAKNRQIQESDAVASKANTEGIAALKAGDYTLAINKFTEGVAAVPDYVGSTPVLLNGKMVALKARGHNIYKEGATSPDANVRRERYEVANRDYDEALAAYEQAMQVIKNAPAPTDAAGQKQRQNLTLELMSNAMEVHRLKAVSGVDTTKGKAAEAIFEQYFAVETDPVKKTAAELTLGDILRETGDCGAAINAYRKILAATPDNPDALAGAGLCLFSEGYGNENKEQMQEGLNLMTRFTEVAPDTHKLKASVKDAVDLLKNEQKLTPQKVTTPRRRNN
jgi:tetratricopeptide (TPR) repeat protein